MCVRANLASLLRRRSFHWHWHVLGLGRHVRRRSTCHTVEPECHSASANATVTCPGRGRARAMHGHARAGSRPGGGRRAHTVTSMHHDSTGLPSPSLAQLPRPARQSAGIHGSGRGSNPGPGPTFSTKHITCPGRGLSPGLPFKFKFKSRWGFEMKLRMHHDSDYAGRRLRPRRRTGIH